MSKKLSISAVRQVTTQNKNGHSVRNQIVRKFRAVQVPADILAQLVLSSTAHLDYIDYVSSLSQPQHIPVYGAGSKFGSAPVRYKEFDWTHSHIENFKEWMVDMNDDGFSIKFQEE